MSQPKHKPCNNCPITGRPFFMWLDHPDLGYVPTYGGPYDSYTIPTKYDNTEGEFLVERYDHDEDGWVEGEAFDIHDYFPPQEGTVE